jgi:hypothetical protein
MKKQRDAHWNASLVAALKEMAELRQASVSEETLVRYCENLTEWELSDLSPVIREISLRTRKKGETAFPPLADIVELLQAGKAHRDVVNKSHAHQEQQEKDFWEHVDYMKEQTGETEQQVLDAIRTPGFTGRKARHGRQ